MEKLKKVAPLLALGVLAYAFLKAMLVLGNDIFVIIYELLAGVPIIVYICIVRGRVGTPPSEEMLPSEWTSDEKKLFLKQIKEQREKGKICIRIAFPFILALIVAVLTEMYIPMLFG